MKLDKRVAAFAKLSQFLKAVASCDEQYLPGGLTAHYEEFCSVWWIQKRCQLYE
jgi:hypothetical protein